MPEPQRPLEQRAAGVFAVGWRLHVLCSAAPEQSSITIAHTARLLRQGLPEPCGVRLPWTSIWDGFLVHCHKPVWYNLGFRWYLNFVQLFFDWLRIEFWALH